MPKLSGSTEALLKMASEMHEAGFDGSKVMSSSWAKPKPTKKVSLEEQEQGLRLLKVGADVEEFLRDKAGKPVPVVGLIGGTKEDPLPILNRKGFALQEDNVALEYNIPPASSGYEFVFNLMRVQEEIVERTAKLGLSPAIESSMRFDMKQLNSDQAKKFGCDSDYCVWEQKVNEKPVAQGDTANLRTAGGHVHISFLVGKETPKFPEHIAQVEALVMACDLHLGIPFVLLDRDMERRKLYGKAGAFRPKPEYGGFEYRVLSNHWTRSPELMGYVYDQVREAFRMVNRRIEPRDYLLGWKDPITQAINTGDVELAKKMMGRFGIMLPAQLKAA